jgi:hypothetical protein
MQKLWSFVDRTTIVYRTTIAPDGCPTMIGHPDVIREPLAGMTALSHACTVR